jgi:hypothetical protein
MKKISIKLKNPVRDAIKGMIKNLFFYFDDVCYFEKKFVLILTNISARGR